MSNASRALSWITRLRTEPTRPASDWADLGTAFGLDQSMQAAHDDATAPKPVEPPPASGWSCRWPRRKPASR